MSDFSKREVNNNGVSFPINGQSNRRTPLLSGRFYFPWQNPGQTLIKNFLKNGQEISGHSVYWTLFFAQTSLCSLFFFLQLADSINNFEVIFRVIEKEYKKRFVKCF